MGWGSSTKDLSDSQQPGDIIANHVAPKKMRMLRGAGAATATGAGGHVGSDPFDVRPSEEQSATALLPELRRRCADRPWFHNAANVARKLAMVSPPGLDARPFAGTI